MHSVKLRSHVGEDGVLHLAVPVGLIDAELDVMVTFSEVKPVTKKTEELGWEPGFFEKTYGSCADEPIVIDNEGISPEMDDNLEGIFDEQELVG